MTLTLAFLAGLDLGATLMLIGVIVFQTRRIKL